MNTYDRRWLILLEGIFYSLLFIVLSLAMMFIPKGLGTFLVLLLPVLPALHAVRCGFSNALGFALVTVGAIGLVFDETTIMMIIFLYGIGLGLGRGFRKQVQLSRSATEAQVTAVLHPTRLPAFLVQTSIETFLQGFCGALIGLLLLLAAAPLLTGMTLVDYFDASMTGIISMVQEQPESFDFSAEQAAEMTKILQSSYEMIQSNPTLVLFCTSLLMTFPVFMIARFFVLRFAGPLPPLPPFRRWGLPRAAAYALCATLLPMLFFDDASHGWFYEMVAGVNQLLFLLCVFQGMAVLDFFLHRWHFPKWLCYLVRPLLFFVPLMQQMLLLVGLVDVGVDMRKLRVPPSKES